MKRKVVRVVLVGAMVIAMVVGLGAGAFCDSPPCPPPRYAVQDLVIFDHVWVNSGGGTIDLAPSLVSAALASPGPAITFPGGATFTPTTEFPGRVADIDQVLFQNTSATRGVLSYGGRSFFSVLTTSDLYISQLTIRESDTLELDLASILPEDVHVGDVGHMDYMVVQFRRPEEETPELSLSPLDIAVSRANAGLCAWSSVDDSHVVEASNQPFVIAEGSKAGRMIVKGIVVGTATGAAFVIGEAVLPQVGLGIALAKWTFKHTLIECMLYNLHDNLWAAKPAPTNLLPLSLPATQPPMPTYFAPGVPEPSSLLALASGLAGLGGVFFRRRRS